MPRASGSQRRASPPPPPQRQQASPDPDSDEDEQEYQDGQAEGQTNDVSLHVLDGLFVKGVRSHHHHVTEPLSGNEEAGSITCANGSDCSLCGQDLPKKRYESYRSVPPLDVSVGNCVD